jgi:Reverse transcriptase (RNA-dependent DNA polymerase)
LELISGVWNLSFCYQNLTKENLKKGYIQPSQLLIASPFFFVSEKDGKLQPCQDYRYLNNWTIKNSYPLPLILEIMDKLKGAKYFTKLDVRWGYNNIRIRKGDKWKVAFKMKKGLFEPTVMFFRMCNSPATFQAMMDNIFMTMIDNQLVIDNILIFANTKEELERITKLTLEKLREHDLFLKAKKCEFCQTRIEYLGMIIEEGKISMDTVKLGGIRDWPVPTTLKQTRSFLGFGNFYQKFISHYSELARSLNDLTKKDKKFEWTTNCQKAFDTMKK